MSTEKNSVVLEESDNSHVLTGGTVKQEKDFNDGSKLLTLKEGDGLVEHGEHGNFGTESSNILKTNQTEYNPVNKAIQKAVD